MRSYAQISAAPQLASPARRARPTVAAEPKLRRPSPARIDEAAPAFDFSGIPPHAPLAPPRIQTKLDIGPAGDEFEQEADRIAEQVMRMPEPQAPSKGRARESELAKAPAAKVRTKALGTNDVGGIEAPPIVHEVLNSSGQPLDAATRAFMEPRFGRDFSQIRVHDDAGAASSAAAIGARAYAAGRDIVFAKGEHAPASAHGRHLLAHELAHIAQQRGTPMHVRRQTKDDGKGDHKGGDKADGDKLKSGEDQFNNWTNPLTTKKYTLSKRRDKKAKKKDHEPDTTDEAAEPKAHEPAKEITGEVNPVYNRENFGREARSDSADLIGKLNEDVMAYLESPAGEKRLGEFERLPQGHALRLFLVYWRDRQKREQPFNRTFGKFGKKIFKAFNDLFSKDSLKGYAKDGTGALVKAGENEVAKHNDNVAQNKEAFDLVPELAKQAAEDLAQNSVIMKRVSLWLQRNFAKMGAFKPTVLAAPNLAGVTLMTDPGSKLADKAMNEKSEKSINLPVKQKGVELDLSAKTKSTSYADILANKNSANLISTAGLEAKFPGGTFKTSMGFGDKFKWSGSTTGDDGSSTAWNVDQQDDHTKSNFTFGQDWKNLGKHKKNKFGAKIGAGFLDADPDSFSLNANFEDGNLLKINSGIVLGSGANNNLTIGASKNLGRFGLYSDFDAKSSGTDLTSVNAAAGTTFSPSKAYPKYVFLGQIELNYDGKTAVKFGGGFGYTGKGALIIRYNTATKDFEFGLRKTLP